MVPKIQLRFDVIFSPLMVQLHLTQSFLELSTPMVVSLIHSFISIYLNHTFLTLIGIGVILLSPCPFRIGFCQLNFGQNFSNFWRVKADTNWLILTPCLIKVAPRWHLRLPFFFPSKVMPIRVTANQLG